MAAFNRMPFPVIPKLTPDKVLQNLARMFSTQAHDRHVYCVFGPYAVLRPFQERFRELVQQGNFNTLGRIEYLSLNGDLMGHLHARGVYESAARVAREERHDEFRRILSETFRDLVTRRIESPDVAGLALADFEMLYACDLGNHDVPLVRQVAINGKRICLLVPGRMHDGQLWIFDDDPESRCIFPEALVFKDSGWVFELAEH